MGISDTTRALKRESGQADDVGLAESVRRSGYTRQQFIDELRDAKYNEALLTNEDERTKTALTTVKLAKKTAAEQGIQPGTPEYNIFLDGEAARMFKGITERAAKVVPAKRVAFRQMINEGVLDSFLDPNEVKQVQDAVANRQLVNRSPTKAYIDFAKNAPDDRLFDVLVKGFSASQKIAKGQAPTLADKYAHLTSDEVTQLAKLQTEPWLPDVAQEQGIVGLGTRILTTEARGAVGAAVRGKQALVNAPQPTSTLTQRVKDAAILAGTLGPAILPELAVSGIAEVGKQLGEHAPGLVEGAKNALRTVGAPLEEADMALREKLLPPGKLGQIASGLADFGPHRIPQQLEAGLSAFAPTSPEQTTFGAPAQDIVKKLRDPATMLKVTTAAAEGAVEGIRGPSNLFSFAREAQTGKEQMALRAAKQAREMMPGQSQEVLDAQAKLLFTQMRERESTSFATESPNTAQSMVEFAVPSAAVAGGMKVAGKAAQAGLNLARKTEIGAQILDKAGDLARWNNPANKIIAEARATKNPATIAQALEEADLQRLALDRGTARATEVVSLLDPDRRLIAGLAKTPAQKALVWQALHNKVPLEQLPPDLLPAYEAAKRLNENLYKAGVEDGWLNRWNAAGELEHAPQRADYGAPHLIKKDPNATIESSMFTYKESPQAGMAKQRTAPMEVFSEDVLAQYDAAIAEAQKKSATAASLNELKTLVGGKATLEATASPVVRTAMREVTEVISPSRTIDVPGTPITTTGIDFAPTAVEADALAGKAIRVGRDAFGYKQTFIEVSPGNWVEESVARKKLPVAVARPPKSYVETKAGPSTKRVIPAKIQTRLEPYTPRSETPQQVAHATEWAMPSSAAMASTVAKDVSGFTRSGGWLIEMPKMSSPKGLTATEAFRAKLQAETGLQWTTIKPENADLFALATGAPGVTKKGAQEYMAPKHWVETVDKLLPLVGVGKESGWVALGEFAKRVVAPWNQMSRAAATSLGGGLQWLGLNVATAQTFPMVAHSLRALDPAITKPALLGALQLASFGDDAAKATQVMLQSGRQTTLGELLAALNKYGFTSQFDASIQGGMKTVGGLRGLSSRISKVASATLPLPVPFPVGLLPGKVGEIARSLSTRNFAQLADNYQRLSTVIGFLEDLTPAAIGSAITKASKYVGNYNRLSGMERDVLGNVVFFYGWAKIAMGSFFAGLKENPKMLADFAKSRLLAERQASQYTPPTAIPSWGMGTMYPVTQGPGNLMVFGAPQTPDVIGMSYLTSAENLVRSVLPNSIDGPTGDKDLGDNMAPAFRNAIELILNVDARWGGPAFLAPPMTPSAYGSAGQAVNTFRRSTVGKIALAPLARPIDQTMAMIDWFMENKQYTAALQFAAGYRATRMMGMGNPLQPEYVADVPKNMALSERRALDRGVGLSKELSR